MRRPTSAVIAVDQPAAGSAQTPKVCFLARRRIHSFGHNRSFPTRSQVLSRSICERQVSGDESEVFVGSSRPIRTLVIRSDFADLVHLG